MRHALVEDACEAVRGWARSGPPPFAAFRRGAAAVLALLGCVAFAAGCSSSGGASASPTVGSTALKIPPPFEVGQKIGLGAVVLAVDSFRRVGDAVTVRVDVTNATSRPLPVAAAKVFSVFYDTGLHPPGRVVGLGRAIPPNDDAIVTLAFTVPARFSFPLLWFDGSVPGTRVGTVVLRGDHSS